jgi:hypothetical protein
VTEGLREVSVRCFGTPCREFSAWLWAADFQTANSHGIAITGISCIGLNSCVRSDVLLNQVLGTFGSGHVSRVLKIS